MQQSVCPQCGSAAQVQTISELVDMLGAMQDQAMMARQQAMQRPQPGWQGPPVQGRDYEGSFEPDPGQDVANAVLSLGAHLIGRAIGKRTRRGFESRVMPVLDARADQARQEQIAIAQKYPEIRCCMSDQVIFLDGGTRVVPLAEVANDITLARADAVVATLRAP
jgi:hypothetical protein